MENAFNNPAHAVRTGSFDLNALAAKLERKSKYKKIRGMIHNLHAAQSAHAELDRAVEKMRLFFEIMPIDDFRTGSHIRQDRRAASLAGSVFQDALLTYVRATHTKSDHRRATPISSRLPGHLLAAHKRITNIRDDAIAHHGPAEASVRRPWVLERSVLEFFSDSTYQISFCNEHTNYMASAVVDLSDLLLEAPKISQELSSKRKEELDVEVENLGIDFEFTALLMDCPFDPSSVYEFQSIQTSYREGRPLDLGTSVKADTSLIDRYLDMIENWPTLKSRYEALGIIFQGR